jgi:hypothetical protein
MDAVASSNSAASGCASPEQPRRNASRFTRRKKCRIIIGEREIVADARRLEMDHCLDWHADGRLTRVPTTPWQFHEFASQVKAVCPVQIEAMKAPLERRCTPWAQGDGGWQCAIEP